MHKTWVHEGGISTPLIAHWPNGIKKTNTIHQARHVVDIMPTLLDIAGASYPKDFNGHGIQDLDGESLLPLFQNAYTERETPIFWEQFPGFKLQMKQQKRQGLLFFLNLVLLLMMIIST